jgi:hypothetical protein
MARTWGRRLAKIGLVLLVLAAVALTFTVGWRPVIGAKKLALTSRKFEVTPALHAARRLSGACRNALHGVRDVHMIFLKVDPKWDTFRTNPRFQELLARI